MAKPPDGTSFEQWSGTGFMRAIGVTEFGGPEALQVLKVPEPHAGPGEVRLRVRAAAISPTDTWLRNGTTAALEHGPPWIPGTDAAGVIDEIGDGVDSPLVPAIGEAAMAIVSPNGPRGGAYADYIVVPAGSVARAPAGASHAQACTLPMNGLTARLALDRLGLRPGQTLAVTGAAGAFGGYMVELGKADGLRVIADASERDRELVARLGADIVVPRGDDIAAQIRKVAPEGVDAVADGAVQNTLVLGAIRDGGQVAAVRPFEGETERNIGIRFVLVFKYLEEQAKLDELGRLVEAGKVTLRVAQAFPAEDAPEAHRLFEGGGIRGRLVLEF